MVAFLGVTLPLVSVAEIGSKTSNPRSGIPISVAHSDWQLHDCSPPSPPPPPLIQITPLQLCFYANIISIPGNQSNRTFLRQQNDQLSEIIVISFLSLSANATHFHGSVANW